MRTKAARKTEAGRDAAANASAPAPPVNGNAAVKDGEAKETKPPFWEFINTLGGRWEADGVVVYCYRIWPVIDRREEPHFLCKIREPFDEDYLLRNFGSGKYLLQANNGRGKTVHKRVVSLHHPNFPPRVSEAEVVASDPRNEVYFKTWGGRPAANSAKPEAKDAARDDIVEVIREARQGNKLDPQVIQWLQDVANHRDDLAAKLAEASAKNPTADLASLITAVKGLMPAQPVTAPSDKSDLLGIITALKSMQPDPLTVLEKAKNLFAPATEPERGHDEIARLDQILGFAQKLAAIRGATGGERNAWDIGLDYAKEIGNPILQLVNNFLMLRRGVAPGMAPGVSPAAPMQPAPFDPYSNPQAMRDHARAVNTQAAVGSQAPPPPAGANPAGAPNASAPPDQATAGAQLIGLLQQYGNLVVNAMNNGTRGCDFADYVSGLLGNATHAMIAGQGEEALVQAMMAIPEISLFGEARLRAFAHEFVHYEEILGSEADAEENAS